MDSLGSLDTIPAPRYVEQPPAGATPWEPAAHGLVMRASGLAPLDVALYDGIGGRHFWVHPLSGRTAAVIDRTGLPDDGWAIARILSDAFHDVGWRETVLHERARRRRALERG